MSTISAASGITGNNKNAFLRINNRHSKYDANLNHSISMYQRQFIFTIADIDQERKELKSFLKKLYHCESDSDPCAKRYVRYESK